VKLNKQTLLPKLALISAILPKSSSKPITECILFDNGKLYATDMTTALEIPVGDTETLCIDGKRFIAIIKAFSGNDIDIIVKDGIAKITDGKSKFELTVIADNSDFPVMPNLQETPISLDGEKLGDVFSHAINFVSEDNLRAVLTGIFVENNATNLNLVSTDSVRLFKYAMPAVNADLNLIIPANSVKLLKQFAGKDLSIASNDSIIQFVSNGTRLVSRLINGKYPNYTAIIPASNGSKLTFKTADILSSINRASLAANQVTCLIKFKLSANQLTLISQDSNSASQYEETLACEWAGEETTIGFNYKKLVSILSIIKGDAVMLINTSKKPVIINDTADPDLLTLIMPSSVEG